MQHSTIHPYLKSVNLILDPGFFIFLNVVLVGVINPSIVLKLLLLFFSNPILLLTLGTSLCEGLTGAFNEQKVAKRQ